MPGQTAIFRAIPQPQQRARRLVQPLVRTLFLEPGTSATNDFSLFADQLITGGVLTSDTVNANGQPRSFKSSGAGLDVGQRAVAITPDLWAASSTAGRVSFWLTLGAYPDSFGSGTNIQDRVLSLRNSGGATAQCGLSVDTSGHLVVVDNAGTAVGTGSTVLALNTFYRIAFCWTRASSSVSELRVYLNGVLEITATNANLGGPRSVGFGMDRWDCTSAVKSIWLTDMYCDDSPSLQDVGSVHVTAKRPLSNGSVNGFTGSGTPSGYGTGNARYVNERALSETNYVSVIGAGSAVTEEYSVDGVSVGDVDLTGKPLVGLMGWCDAKALLSETAQLVVAGVQTPIALTSTPTRFMAAALPPTTYPAGGTDIGIVTDTTVTTVTLYECGLIVAYISVGVAYTLNLVGSLSPAGAMTRSTTAQRTGATTPAGAMTRTMTAGRSGQLAPAGASTRLWTTLRAGQITPAGAILRSYVRAAAGTLSPGGAITRALTALRSGSITPAGAITRQTTAQRAGQIAPSGVVRGLVSALRSGQIAPSGAITRSLSSLLSGALSPAGAILRSLSRQASGQVAPAGNLQQTGTGQVGGTVGPSGAPRSLVTAIRAGSMTPQGAISATKVIVVNLVGSLNPTGAIQRLWTARTGGTVAPTGALRQSVTAARAGALGLAGTVRGAFARSVAGSIQPVGVVSATRIKNAFVTGSLGLGGALRQSVTAIRSGSTSPTGSASQGGSSNQLLVEGLIRPTGAIIAWIGKRAEAIMFMVQRRSRDFDVPARSTDFDVPRRSSDYDVRKGE